MVNAPARPKDVASARLDPLPGLDHPLGPEKALPTERYTAEIIERTWIGPLSNLSVDCVCREKVRVTTRCENVARPS